MLLAIISLTQNNTQSLGALAASIAEIDDEKLVWYIKDASSNRPSLEYLKFIEKNWHSKSILKIDRSTDIGLFNALNIAAVNANAKYYCNFNPDDVLITSSLKKALKDIEVNSHIDIHTFPLWVENSIEPKGARKKSKKINKDGARAYFDGCATSLVISKAIHQKIGGFSEKWRVASDIDFMIRLAKHVDTTVIEHVYPIGVYGVAGVSSKISFRIMHELWNIYKNHVSTLNAIYLVAKALYSKLKSVIKG